MLRAARIHARAGAWRSRWRAGEGGGAGAPGQDSDPRAAAHRVSPTRGRERLRHPAADPKAVFHAGRVRARCPALELRRWERPARCDIGHGSELWAHHRSADPHPPRLAQVAQAAAGHVAPWRHLLLSRGLPCTPQKGGGGPSASAKVKAACPLPHAADARAPGGIKLCCSRGPMEPRSGGLASSGEEPPSPGHAHPLPSFPSCHTLLPALASQTPGFKYPSKIADPERKMGLNTGCDF